MKTFDRTALGINNKNDIDVNGKTTFGIGDKNVIGINDKTTFGIDGKNVIATTTGNEELKNSDITYETDSIETDCLETICQKKDCLESDHVVTDALETEVKEDAKKMENTEIEIAEMDNAEMSGKESGPKESDEVLTGTSDSVMTQLPKSQSRVKEITKNMSKSQYSSFIKELTHSMALIEGFRAAAEISDESLDNAISGLLTQSFDLVKGIITPDSIKGALRVANYDRDMALSRHDGVIEGRNTRISQLMKEYEPADSSPRMPSNASFSRTSNSIFELADSAR